MRRRLRSAIAEHLEHKAWGWIVEEAVLIGNQLVITGGLSAVAGYHSAGIPVSGGYGCS